MHNGMEALDGAVELVEYLYKKQKKLIILSNTSAPADKALEKLPKFGFSTEHFQGAVTSGEESSRYILETYGGGGGGSNSDSQKVTKAVMFTWDASKPNNPRLTAPPEAYLERCGTVEVATSVEDADLVLFHGSEVWYKGPNNDVVSLAPFIEQGDFSQIDPILQACQARNLPAVCANPDFVVQNASGDGVAHMPGKIAARYESMKGSCRTFGKPQVEHFEACIRTLGLDKRRVAHVGDSLHHDIAGAVRAGIPNVFVTSGIHKNDFGTHFGELPTAELLEALMEKEGGDTRPTHVVPAFRLWYCCKDWRYFYKIIQSLKMPCYHIDSMWCQRWRSIGQESRSPFSLPYLELCSMSIPFLFLGKMRWVLNSILSATHSSLAQCDAYVCVKRYKSLHKTKLESC